MSGLEQRTRARNEAPAAVSASTAVTERSAEANAAGASTVAPPAAWSAIDADLLDEHRAPVPAFPLGLLPQPWSAWVSGVARAADVPVDYVAQAVLAAAAGVGGTAIQVCPSKSWIEPLQLWLAVVGAPSTGKSPALAPVWGLLHALECDRNPADTSRQLPRRIVLGEPTLREVDEALQDGWHGRLLWRDGADGCFTPLKGMSTARHLETLNVSLLGSIEPDRVAADLHSGGGVGLAARFLYAWPHPAPYCPLAERADPESRAVLASLRRLLHLSERAHCKLVLDKTGAAAFDAFLARLHGDTRQAEGAEAAWLGKGRGRVACLAGLFTLMAWSATDAPEPGLIDREAVERAVSLWSDYYRPHARAFLQGAVPTDLECQARRVVRWLCADPRESVSKTDVRCSALGRTVDARGVGRVMSRLVEAGVLQPMANEKRGARGRPALRWHVNPLVANA